MVKPRSLRRLPSTPDLKSAHTLHLSADHHRHTAEPTSPPETPAPSSPTSRKISLKPRRQPDFRDIYQPLDSDPNIRPVGNGHQFSYQPTLLPEQLSPRSSSSSSVGDDSSDDDVSSGPEIRSLPDAPGPAPSIGDSDDDSEESDSESTTSDSDSSNEGEISHLTAATTTVVCNFIVEDIDPMDSDCEGLEVLQPTEIETSNSHSKTHRNKELDKGMMEDMRNLTCSNETSDNDDDSAEIVDKEEVAFLRRKEQLRKFRRLSNCSSFGKRTHSELSDSDDDGEGADFDQLGSSAHRFRRKMQRTSLLFHDPPPACIEELEEPDSSEDEYVIGGPGQSLARELPYWTMEIMEMGST